MNFNMPEFNMPDLHKRKKRLRRCIMLFFTLLLVLTFLSNTIQGLSLPKVAVEEPETGGLDLNVSGDGFLQPAYTALLYPEAEWTVKQIHVSKNYRVQKGDALVTFDTTRTESILEDEQARRKQLEFKLETLTSQLKTALRGEDQDAIDTMKRELETGRLDLEVQQRAVAKLERQIAEGGTLKAPMDGVVTAVNAAEGGVASPGQPAVEIAGAASGYQFSTVADSDDASALRIGDTVQVKLDETPQRTIEGVISEIEDTGSSESGAYGASNKKITFDVKDAALEPGLKASVDITHQSDFFGMKIPKSALQSDNNGYYVFIVTEKDGPLGIAYYVSKTYITVKDENKDTVIIDGLMPGDKYVTESSEPIGDGDRVRY
ncbi:efflux RND transporter periplasmic adaptor subunit [Paenibacillus sp. M1]|uniref:Efflux RND transporter periplasmic adaptor subunit n=1 Tax=Paenibacillus haidiansis TaxID=1574488 RepID=A0ABU7VQ00_9BACL